MLTLIRSRQIVSKLNVCHKFTIPKRYFKVLPTIESPFDKPVIKPLKRQEQKSNNDESPFIKPSEKQEQKSSNNNESTFIKKLRQFWMGGFIGTLIGTTVINVVNGVELELMVNKYEEDSNVGVVLCGLINGLEYNIIPRICSAVLFPCFWSLIIYDYNNISRMDNTIFGDIKKDHYMLFFIPSSFEIINTLTKLDKACKRIEQGVDNLEDTHTAQLCIQYSSPYVRFLAEKGIIEDPIFVLSKNNDIGVCHF
jgi:hypothetical protein